ncbi:response regulator transcription factor [Streptomyces sp. NA04227]|uniref:helix-turn-helix transcriptional regulator n=1 Tax=Streptomyces sp. NA04227 TaxID=2742136 RepID=UPI00159285B7|nr:LuxR C-terminal-related transcriptional regulator [Streptomyces sp. NA04227]QKW09056.1 response regulator transcription factor [Streptomyces sp. NA04227]
MDSSPGRVTDIAQELGRSREDVSLALKRLAELHLVSVADDGESCEAHDPGVVLPVLLSRCEAQHARRQRELNTARSAVAALTTEYGHTRAQGHNWIRRLHDPADIRWSLRELAESAESECLAMVPNWAEVKSALDAGAAAERLALESGAVLRNVYDAGLCEDPAVVRHIRRRVDLGGEIRTVPALTMPLVIVDRRVALVAADPQNLGAGALEVRAPGLISALVLLFERCWATATPFTENPREGASPLGERERELVRLLSSGSTDEAAARKLGVSKRTIRRMNSQLMERLGARSRFEAAVLMAQQGWI